MRKDTEFKAVYDDYKNLVYNLALNYVQNISDAQDITQEVFVKVYQNIHRYNPEASSLKTWIYRIAINQSLDFLKMKKARKRFGFITSLFRTDSNQPVVEAESSDHPGIALEDKEQLQNLFRLINALPANQKTVVILLKAEDRSQKEVAEIMGVSEKAVESLFQRAKHALNRKIKGGEGI
ncbi:ECF RNA polymerase sigma factor SigW [Dyadobacter sp. CECT 9275]|uniref:RNA polymerase sigma factor n=1 Tax=Dyadobacter helix TaxID=2822344 RepID=A0A916JFJ7_9BACT|nr:RNA polymerase sigma factor [Dyadobacter sp. CECT 9275]CAG5008544.1 ECF RNA polymerase sigma factor SigW [Dyadobacter sp. CECT 9275]